MVIRVKHSGLLPRQGWQLCRVTGGSFAVKWVAAFVCNGWQLCREIRSTYSEKDKAVATSAVSQMNLHEEG